MGQSRNTANLDEAATVHAGSQNHQHPQWILRVHSLIDTDSSMHCMLALHLKHLLLASRTSSSSFKLNKHFYVYVYDFYVLNAHPACTTKLILPESSKVFSKGLETLMFCRYPAETQPDLTCVNQWPKTQHPWALQSCTGIFMAPDLLVFKQEQWKSKLLASLFIFWGS